MVSNYQLTHFIIQITLWSFEIADIAIENGNVSWENQLFRLGHFQ